VALRLRVEHGSDSGRTVRLAVPGRYRFGRTPQSSYQILDMKVSKDHFEIWVGNGAAPAAGILDLESSHGTWVNAQRVAGPLRPLSPGDEIRIGMTVLRVLSDGPADADVAAVGPVPTEKEWAAAAKASPAAGPTVTTVAPSAPAPAPAPPRKAQPPDPLVGRTLAGYKILERVGSGGMGAVYKAEQLSLHREVALKVLAERLVTDSAFVDQFVNEARAAGALNHPNVVQVYDVGQADGRHFFSMEFIHGGSLEDRLAGGGAPWEEALPWFQDAANALVFAEKKGILHRDIKPDNLMVSQDGTVKLCDLGLAKKSESADLLAQGIIGTPHFIAPEAIRRRLEVDKRADLYSLGCSFFRILTGRNPFAGASVKEILLAHLNQPPPRVTSLAAGVPKELEEVVLRLMQKEPDKRYADAEELWEALDKIRLQHGLAQHGIHPGRAKKVALLVGSIAVVAIGIAGYVIATTKDTTTVVTVPGQTTVVTSGSTGPTEQEVRENAASGELKDLRLNTVTEAGRLDDGENWLRAPWQGYPAKLRDLAQRHEGTAAAKEAATEAGEVEIKLADKRKDADAAAAERTKARDDLKAALAKATEAVKTHLTDGNEAAAEVAVVAAAKQVDEIGKLKRGGGALLPPEEIRQADDSLKALAEGALQQAESVWTKTKGDAETAFKAGGPELLQKAVDLYAAYLKRPEPPAEATGPVGKAVRTHRDEASVRQVEIGTLLKESRQKLLAEDKRAYLDLLKVLYDGASDGLYSGFRFSDASARAAEAFDKVKTTEYRDAVQEHQRAARHLTEVVNRLAKDFLTKPWEDKLASTGVKATDPWKEPMRAEDVTAGGVTIDKRFRHYKVLGIPWFFSTALVAPPKGEPRVALSADEREALGMLALGALVGGAPDMLAVAEAQWDAAAALDPARADRLARLRARAKAEHAVVVEYLAIAGERQKLEEEMAGFDLDAPGKTVDAFDKNDRPKILEKAADWKARIEAAKARFAKLLEDHQDTFFVVVTSKEGGRRAVFFEDEIRPPKEQVTGPKPPEDGVPGPAATDRPKDDDGVPPGGGGPPPSSGPQGPSPPDKPPTPPK
jgi:hypothetical protein